MLARGDDPPEPPVLWGAARPPKPPRGLLAEITSCAPSDSSDRAASSVRTSLGNPPGSCRSQCVTTDSDNTVRDRIQLTRIDGDSYGQCVDCGHEIPEGRLDARPDAARCVGCQSKWAKRQR